MLKNVFMLITLNSCLALVIAKEFNFQDGGIETFVVEPVRIDAFYGWVPADKAGPTINWSCQPEEGGHYTNSLVSQVEHTREPNCPDALAIGLAEYSALSYTPQLPLTIFNGWQWEYNNGLSQFKATPYPISKRGGAWEGNWESILLYTHATRYGYWDAFDANSISISLFDLRPAYQSDIDIRTFEHTKVRDGYPKQLQLSR